MGLEKKKDKVDVSAIWSLPGCNLLSSIFFAFRYVSIETIKKPVGFLIGLFTVIVVVFVISFLQNVLTKVPIIFFKMTEDTTGDADIIMTPAQTNSSQSPFLNQTYIDDRLKDNALVWGTSARWNMLGRLYNRDNPNYNTSSMLLILDSEHETTIGEGRAWDHRIIGEGECHMSLGLVRALGLKPNRGSKVKVEVDFATLMQAAGQTQTNTSLSSTEMILSLLAQQGVDINQPLSVNITDVIDRFNITINPLLRRLIQANDPVSVPLKTVITLLNIELKITGEYTIADSIEDPKAKYTAALGNVVVLDSKYLLKTIKKSIYCNNQLGFILNLAGGNLKKNVDTFFDTFPLKEYAFTVLVMYAKRYSSYFQSAQPLDNDMIDFSNSIVSSIGVDFPVSFQFPIVEGLATTQFLSLFLDQIFVGVVVMIGVLGVILIYTILIGKVEEKTYEYGMLRALGLPQTSLIEVILVQALYFALPGIIVAMILSWGVGIGVDYIMVYIATLPPPILMLATWAIIIPILVGIFIPILSNIIPIRRALSKTLRDSLDIAHISNNDTSVRMIKLAELGLEPWQTALSLVLVVCGFVVYYVIPYTFIFNDLPLFFTILNCILLGMLFGLCMVASVFQPILERIVLFFILWGPDRRLMTLISKNLAGHRGRSRKTFLMFVLAIAFIIFAGVVFSLQNASISSNLEVLVGADIVAQAFLLNKPVDPKVMTPYLDSLIERGEISNYAYQTFAMTNYPFITETRFASLAYYPSRRINVAGIDRRFLSSVVDKFFLYTEYDGNFYYKRTPSNKLDLIDSLYTHAGQAIVEGERRGYVPDVIFSGRKIGVSYNDSLSFDPATKYNTYLDVIVSEALRDEVSVRVGQPLQLKIKIRNPKTGRTSSEDYISKARALVNKVPGFFYSSYRFAASGSTVLISIDQFYNATIAAAQKIGYENMNELNERNYERVYVKLTEKGFGRKPDIMNEMKSRVDPDFSAILDIESAVASTTTASTVILAFYNVVAVIAVLLCFFTLTLSFEANVRENSWEFGVIRAVGLSVSALIRSYIYEALCLVASSLICGFVIGVTIALTLTAQFNLFLEMPFQFDFPYILFFSLIAMALVVAVFGSWIPARVLRKKEIAIVLRGL